VRLRFADELPGHGLRAYRLAPGAAPVPAALRAETLAGGGAAIENEAFRIECDAHGRVTLSARASGKRIDDALRLVSEGDRGDEYNFDPVPNGAVVDRADGVRVRARRRGAEVELRIEGRLAVPVGLDETRAARAARTAPLRFALALRLAPGLDRVDVALDADNRSCDHRLRLVCRAPFAARRFEVESAFEIAERPIAPAPDAFGAARPAERPIGACPQRSFATLAGADLALTVANRGAAEVEALPGDAQSSALAVTVLRAVGWLSRPDLALRPGPAGPALATPGAQVPGPHRIELSIRLHAAGERERVARAHGFAFAPLAFAGVEAGDGALADGARLVAVDDPELVVSAIEPASARNTLVRLVAMGAQPRSARVAWSVPAPHAEWVDLAGRTVAAVGTPGHVDVSLRPWQIATLRLRGSP
jgi:2-O-(6-phospho-alpha-D-mannosyl)-D-glycerate hydrolase